MLALLLLAVIFQAQPKEQEKDKGGEPKAQSKVVFSWTYNTPIAFCHSGQAPVYCIDHFTLSEGKVKISDISSTSSGSFNFSYVLTPLPRVGTHTYNLVAVEILTGTATISSGPATVTVRCIPKKCM